MNSVALEPLHWKLFITHKAEFIRPEETALLGAVLSSLPTPNFIYDQGLVSRIHKELFNLIY